MTDTYRHGSTLIVRPLHFAAAIQAGDIAFVQHRDLILWIVLGFLCDPQKRDPDVLLFLADIITAFPVHRAPASTVFVESPDFTPAMSSRK